MVTFALRSQLLMSVSPRVPHRLQGTKACWPQVQPLVSVDPVQQAFEAVKTAAKQDYNSQVSDMQDALQQLQTAVGNLGSGDAAANILAVGKAVTATTAAANDLFTHLQTDAVPETTSAAGGRWARASLSEGRLDWSDC